MRTPMTHDGTIESVKIETDERNFELHVQTGEGELFRFLLTDPEALYDLVKAEIGPWLYERDAARATLPVDSDDREGWATDAERDAGEFHAIHADIWDAREGK